MSLTWLLVTRDKLFASVQATPSTYRTVSVREKTVSAEAAGDLLCCESPSSSVSGCNV